MTTTTKATTTTTKATTSTTKATTTTTKATTTTTKATTTTAKATTSTTKATTTTAKATTSTTKATTTTTKATTTTTKATTTTTTTTITSTVTSTTATTTTTTATTTNNSVNPTVQLLETAIENVSVKDTAIPCYSGDLYEVKDAIFLFKNSKVNYAYTLLCEEETSAPYLFSNPTLIKGLHIWKYTGNAKAVAIGESLPDTEDLTFYYEDPTTTDTEFEYELDEYSALSTAKIVYVAKQIAEKKPIYAFDVATYDYNLDGKLDVEDIEIMIKYVTAYVPNILRTLNANAVLLFTTKISTFSDYTNFVLLRTDSTKPIEYALNIPTQDMGGGTSYPSVRFPVQILPSSDANVLENYEENSNYSDETADYYAWDISRQMWCKVSTSDSKWRFQAGYYVFVLDEAGNNCYYFLE